MIVLKKKYVELQHVANGWKRIAEKQLRDLKTSQELAARYRVMLNNILVINAGTNAALRDNLAILDEKYRRPNEQ